VVFVQLESVTGTDCVGAAINKCGTAACAVASASGAGTTAPARGPGNGSRGSDARA